MRSAGCVINDYFDMEFDGSVQRTKDRPLVTGIVKPSEALILFFFLIFLSGLLLNWMNWLTIKVAAFGLVLATFYPLTKRFFAIPQFFLGLAFSWGILMVSAAELNRINYISIILFASCFQILSLAIWSSLGYILNMHPAFYISSALWLYLITYQYNLIKSYDRQSCFLAFKNNNWVGVSLLTGSILGTSL